MALPNPTTPMFPDYAVAITASDSLRFPPSAIYVGSTGNVAIYRASDGTSVTFVSVPTGAVVPCMAIGVASTGTTASSLVRIG